MGNVDEKTIASFGDEWSRFRQDSINEPEYAEMFERYFSIFPWSTLPNDAEGFDMGCGSGRWARRVAPRVGKLHCIDPSGAALGVARESMRSIDNIIYTQAGVSNSGLLPHTQDFGYSLGVLHHVPDTRSALQSCTELLKPGAPFLLYLYYRFDNKPIWFRALWKASDLLRRIISRLPPALKNITTDLIAIVVYWPLSRISRTAERLGLPVDNIPLSSYRNNSIYTLRTDSRDRFGTPLERRFTREEIRQMMEQAHLENIVFSDRVPFWCAVGYRK